MSTNAAHRTIVGPCTAPLDCDRRLYVLPHQPFTVPAGMVAVVVITTPEHARALCSQQIDDQPGDPT